MTFDAVVASEGMGHCNEADLDWSETDHDEHGFRRKKLAAAAGGDELGCSLYELPPGKRSWPLHFHTGNEEAVYVLAGSGTARLADGEHDVAAGDYLALPAGEAGLHQVVNDGDEPLRYLAMSTMADPDVTVYPEQGTFGVYAGSAPGSDEERTVEGYYRPEDAVDYWEPDGDAPASR
jgi:uncharacterized cupin superfamily protein